MKDFLIQLPFKYKKAVLTQARTAAYKPYAFIVEFDDGIRKFLKGPFRTADLASGHLICNEVKRTLKSRYLHPLHYEIKKFGVDSIFLECEELGRSDLGNVVKQTTKLEKATFTVLEYNQNDVVPDPLKYLEYITEKNADIWIQVLVNYSFRWVFGIGDTARRNLMLQKSTGRIYSTDETGIENVNHANVWGGKKPDRRTFRLVRSFVKSAHFNSVINEVGRWQGYLTLINHEVMPLSVHVENRIDKLISDPIMVFDI